MSNRSEFNTAVDAWLLVIDSKYDHRVKYHKIARQLILTAAKVVNEDCAEHDSTYCRARRYLNDSDIRSLATMHTEEDNGSG